MNTNQKYNETAINQFRKELRAMLGDITDIDIKCLNKAVDIGLADVKRNTPVGIYSGGRVGGNLRIHWNSDPATKSIGGVTRSLDNNVEYASYVNYGHRVVNKSGETVGFVKGQYMLEKAISKVDKQLAEEFKNEVERVEKAHDK